MQREFVEKTKETFARLSDEFYITGKKEIPSDEHYGDFDQIEDGIGMTRYFETIVNEDLEFSDFDGNKANIALITGVMCSENLERIKKRIEEKLNVIIKVYIVKNNCLTSK